MNFEKLNKACKEANEIWREMMNENNPFDTISKIARDIADKKDKEVALEFTKQICTLLKNKGVSPVMEEYIQDIAKENSIERKYGVAITGLDFTEHDKKFKDEIRQLKHELEKTYNQLMEFEKEAQEKIAELESELEVKDNLLKIKNGLCKPPMMTVVVAKTINGQDYVRLEDFMSVVNDLQNYDLYHAE